MSSRSISRRVWDRVSGRDLLPIDWRRIRSLSPRVLHSHFGDQGVDDLVFQRRLGVPWVVSFYGADAYQLGSLPEWRARYATVFDRSSQILALGPAMEAALRSLGCPPEKLFIHPLGVDFQSLPKTKRTLHRGEPLKVLFAGTFREKKGVEYLVDALGLLRRQRIPVQLHLVGDATNKSGDSETKQRILRKINGLGLESSITHYPFLPFSEVIDLALRCHVFACPSVTAKDGDSEGTPFVLQQMMATEMPVISTLHSDIPFLFGELSGMLVPERDAAAIARRLLSYAKQPETLLEDGAKLRARIVAAFDARDRASELSNIYDQILGTVLVK